MTINTEKKNIQTCLNRGVEDLMTK